jgi:hypothetical protein
MLINKIPIITPPTLLLLANFIPLQSFTTDTLNWRVSMVDPATDQPTDNYVYRYHNLMYSAYLEKRRLKRSEIWPKIHIIDGVP